MRTANDAIYLEGGGPGVAYSVNYDRRFYEFAVRVGGGYWSSSTAESPLDGQPARGKSTFAIPLTLSYLGVGSWSHKLELGAGVALWGERFWYDASATEPASSNLDTQLVPLGLIGYRYQPPDGGFSLRTGLTVLAPGGIPYPIFPWPYLAAGWAID